MMKKFRNLGKNMLLCIPFVSYAKVMGKNLFVSSLQMFLRILKITLDFSNICSMFCCYHAYSFMAQDFVSLSVLCCYLNFLPMELLMKLIKLLSNLIRSQDYLPPWSKIDTKLSEKQKIKLVRPWCPKSLS